MTEQTGSQGPAQGGDRRGVDRRRGSRRTPLPLWKRPWAYAAYGVAGVLLLILLFDGLGGDDDEAVETGRLVETQAPPPVDRNAPPAAAAPVRDAYAVGDFERLVAEGGGAQGQRVRTELYCEAVESVALSDSQPVGQSVGVLADANRRVPAAECKWGPTASAPDLLLLVPPTQAQRMGAAPEVVQGFIRRRRVRAEVEWVGRSEALQLRNVAVLRSVQ